MEINKTTGFVSPLFRNEARRYASGGFNPGARYVGDDIHNVVPRIDRVRLANRIKQSRDPKTVCYRDVLYMPYGKVTVCRVDLGVSGDETSYLCTDGTRTLRVYDDDVTPDRHYRDGVRVAAYLPTP